MSDSADTPPHDSGAAPLDPDRLLVERTLAGDSRAFDLLVMKHQRRVQRLIARMVRDTDLVEDIAQDTFINAYRALSKFRGDAQFYTWLYRIAVNTAKRALLERRREPSMGDIKPTSTGDDETFVAQYEPSTDETPESVFSARQIAGMVDLALQDLSPELRQAISLREIDGMTYEEIAELMDCPVGTVRSRIFRAREAVAQRIAPLLEHRSGKRW